uniref:right-handed parallel beta-helix repeat-containing protein n=1 Tax=Cloacibacillus evryensis TaxID=508460 RepID=UPI00241FBD2F
VSGCVNGGAVSGSSNIGGIAGALSVAIASDCANAGAVTGDGNWDSGIGGIAGYGSDAGVVNCLNRGDVMAENADVNAGGIVGYYHNISAKLCTNMGQVYGGGYAGGILGRHDYGASTVASCASVGGVSGGENTGAIVGGAFSMGPNGTKDPHATLSNCLWYESGPVNAGLKAAGDDNSGTFTSAMAASADNYGTLAATYVPDPASAMILAGRTKTLFRSWPGVNTSAVTAVSYDVSPDIGLTLSADVNKSVAATMSVSGDYRVNATATFTPLQLAGDGAQTAYTTENMTLRVGEGWPYLPVVYVTPGGAGEKDGSSWANAMGGADFSAMLKWIDTQNSGKNYNFYVAKGTYAQSETLPLPKGVKLYGGFAGTETETIASRDIKTNVSTLTAATGASISIVTGGKDATSADTVLDGFTITGGKGTVTNVEISGFSYYDPGGGGLFNDSSSPLIANCTFSGNYCYAGPAIFNCRDSSPYVYRCSFEKNEGGYGGAVCSESFGSTGAVAPSFVECVFKNNSGAIGGAIFSAANGNTACTPFIDKCRFLSNQTTQLYGGAITDEDTAHSTISNSEFTGNFTKNVARASGGAIFINAVGKTSVITNCTFANNKANGDGSGGALYVNRLSSLIIANCTFSGNGAANKGGAVYSASTPVTAVNSIFWGDTAVSGDAEIAHAGGGSSASLYNSVVQGGWTKGGDNISEIDPMFLTASPDDNGGPVPTMAVSAGGSAYRAGLKPGASFTGADGKTYTTPLTDARGVSFDVTSADIGAYAWKAGGGFSVSGSLELAAGASADLAPYAEAKLVSTDVHDTNAGRAAVWTSASTDIATVSDGVASGVAKGKTTLTASFGGVDSGSLPVTVFAAHGDVTEERMTDTPDANGYGSGVIAVSSDAKESIAIYDALGLLSADQKLPANIDPTANPIDASSVDVTTSADIYTSADIRGAVARYLSIDAEAEGDSPYKVRLVQVNNTVASRAGEGDTLFAKFWRFLRSLFGNDGEQAKHADDYLPLQTNFVISEDQLPGHLADKFGRQKDGDQFTSNDMTEFIREVNPFVVVKSGDAVEARSLYDIVSGDVTKYITVERARTTGAGNINHFTYTIKTRVLLFNKAGAVTEGAGKEFVMPVALSDDAKTRESGNYFLVEDGAEDDRYDLCLAFAVKTPKVLHVKPNGGDGNNSGDGATWDTALTSADFADRLRQINGKVEPSVPSYYAADEYGYEFWVASGDYRPTADDDSGYYFALTSNVRLYGGFAGTERSVDGRAAGNVSTLSGKLANVKARDVLSGTEVKGAVVDGFTVSGGDSGLRLDYAEVRISGCRVVGNTERGFYASSSRLEIESSLIAANGASGIDCDSGTVTLKDSTLTGNKTGAVGGAVYMQGGICALRAENCTFSGNSAESNGGAVSFVDSSGELLLANCTFSGNSAGTEGGAGGAIANPPAGFKIYNTLFAGNTATSGKDVYAPNQGELVNCRFDADGIYAYNITSTDCTTADALLLTASPDDNGGPVPTMAVSAGGSAFRAGVTPGMVISGGFKTPPTDARGVSFDKAHAEIGAYAYEIASADASVKTGAPEELILGTSSDIGKVFSLAAHLTGTASPDRYAAAFNITSVASDVVSVDNGALYALKTGSSTVTAESTKGTQADGNPVEFSEVTKTLKVAISVASLDISERSRVIRRGASAQFSLVLPNGYTSADIESRSRDITWSLTGTDYSIKPSADGLSATVTAGNVLFDASSTITATIAGKTSGETKTLTATVSTPVGETPKPPVTPANRTDGAGGESGSGILEIVGTSEDFAIYDAMKDLGAAANLPDGISADAKPIGATSADVVTSEDLFSAEQIKAAVTKYWGLGAASEDRVRLVEVQNTVASRADEGGTLFAKVWRFLVSLFTRDGGNEAPDAGDYLPIEAHFTIGSADIAALPEEVKEGLSAGNLLSKVNLFAVVSEDGKVSARSLADAASGDLAAYITVSGGNDAGYTVQTRVMLFDMKGGVSGDAEADKAAGARWVQPLKAASSDARPNDKDNYFIVQDGAEDDRYDLCLAFAAKEPNYAEVSVTASGDIESKDIEYVRWTVSGDAAQHEAGSSADIRGGEQSVTLIVPGGCHVTLSDETQTLSRDVEMISADVTWGGEWKITALFEKIKAESVTLDKTTLALAAGGSYKLTAKAAPAEAYANYALWAWTTSDGNVAEVAADGTVTAKAAGKATITAAANDGSGAKAECAVTVRNSAADDPAVTPAEPEAVKPEVVTPNENVVPVTPGYVTDPVKQEDVMNEIGLKAEDAAVTENGSLTVAGGLADKAAGEVIANDPDTVSKDSVISLPVTVSSADEAGMIHALGFKVSGDVFGKVNGVSEIRVLKIFTDGGGKAFTVVTAAEAIADKTVALYDANNEIVTGAIDAAATYTLTAFVLDGGEYDLGGKTDGKVIDPIAIIKQAEPPVSPTPTPTGGSGGGCNAGAGALALAALIPLAVRRGKR